VPRLYHDGGYRSILPSGFVKSVELIPGGYGGAYGRALGGIVTVALRPLDDDGSHGSVGADAIDASADVRAKIGDRAHVAVGVRKSYLDTVLSTTTNSWSSLTHTTRQDVADVIPIPRYWDGQARVVFDLAPHETIEAGGFASSDRIDHTLLNPNPALSTRQTSGTDFQRFYLRYEKHTADGAVITFVPSFGFDSTSLVNVFGTTPTDVKNDSTVLGARADWHGPLFEHVRGNVGLDAEIVLSQLHRFGSIGAPPREGDMYVFGQPPPGQIATDDWKTTIATMAAFVEGDASLFGDRLHLVPGIRFEPYITATSKVEPIIGGQPAIGTTREETVVEPRVSVRYSLTDRITVKAAFGSYHQSPQPEDLSASFGTPSLVLSTSQHYLVGSSFQLTEALAVETTAFLSESQDLVVRSQEQSPFVGHALDQSGIGRVTGTQFLLRQQQVGRFFGWVSYTIMRSQRKDAPTLDWRYFDYDQTHVFTALGSYDLGNGFEVGARLRYATGYPRTPVIQPPNSLPPSYQDANNYYQPTFGPHNSIRIPPFVAVDLRAAKRFKIGRADCEVYLDVQNVTNHSNPEEIVYNTAYAQRGYITGMPLLPNLGARLSW
jgi:hypothetical protein